MMIIEVRAKLIIAVAMVTTLSNAAEVNAGSSGGFRGDVRETMRKSRHRIVHTIEMKSSFATLPTLRDPIFINRRPGEKILQKDTDIIIGCLRGWKEPDCQTCAHGWTGDNCDTCTQNFGPVGQCDTCEIGWAGLNCDSCAHGWTGDNCTKCDTNFGPAGQCDRCLTGWAGENCDACATGWAGAACNACEFGFSTESGCSECVQSGHWTGKYNHVLDMTVHLTFEGPACTMLASGMMDYSVGGTAEIIDGNYNVTTGTLTINDDTNWILDGQVNVVDKSVTGTIRPNVIAFSLNYQGTE